MTHPTLTPRQQAYLEHLQQAEALGISLRQYADTNDLKVKDLYNVKRQLVKKGVLATPAPVGGDFVSVRIADTGESAVCRLRHPSGWELTCGDWPPVAWLSALLSEVQ